MGWNWRNVGSIGTFLSCFNRYFDLFPYPKKGCTRVLINVYRLQDKTIVSVPETLSEPSGTAVSYTFTSPSYPLTYKIQDGQVVVTINHVYSRGEKFNLLYQVSLTGYSIYTEMDYEVSVKCRKECLYCDNDDTCIACASGYEDY
jgi:hypothetical protein